MPFQAISIQQIRAARAMLGQTQQSLAKAAGVSIATLNNIERGAQTDPKQSTLRAIQYALERQGITFINTGDNLIGIHYNLPADGAKPRSILIIDDNDADRKLYRKWLTKSDRNYRFYEASNAREGYETYMAEEPDCILLDFNMYGMNGFQLLVQMKEELAQIPPIIFVTGIYTESMEKDVMANGASMILSKNDLTRDKLNDSVTRVLRL